MTLYLLQRKGCFARRDGSWTRKQEDGAHFERILAARKFCLEHKIRGAELVLIVAAGERVWIPMPGVNGNAPLPTGEASRRTAHRCNPK